MATSAAEAAIEESVFLRTRLGNGSIHYFSFPLFPGLRQMAVEAIGDRSGLASQAGAVG